MEISEQIEVLKLAKKEYIYWWGLCVTLRCVLSQKLNIEELDLLPIKQYIPSFNYTHISNLCDKNNLSQVRDKTYLYWWNIYDKVTRLKVLNLLIKELEENENKNS